MDKKIIKRFISERVLGYQKNSEGDITGTVTKNHVEWQDGTTSITWTLQPTKGLTTTMLDTCPPIDVTISEYRGILEILAEQKL